MRILVGMNLSPSWCPVLIAAGFDALHWSEALRQFESELSAGALISVDEARARARLFPLRPH